uniref:Conserved plasma membrane protein n=1 Tax=Gongylonema pulchrum TaxID=637853 RepID=A0A183EJU1_9BILA
LQSSDFVRFITSESTVVRLAGLSGALAISLGAYGAHAIREAGTFDERRMRAFDTGNRYHLLHSVALLGAVNARYPWLTASLFLGGMLVFSGSCYHYSITGNECLRKYTPVGGLMYIIAWLTLLL